MKPLLMGPHIEDCPGMGELGQQKPKQKDNPGNIQNALTDEEKAAQGVINFIRMEFSRLTGEIALLRADVSRLTEERDALAAELFELRKSYMEDEVAMHCAGMTKRIDTTNYTLEAKRILDSRDAAQRKAGAIWALQEIEKRFLLGKGVSTMAAEKVRLRGEIERGEVKP